MKPYRLYLIWLLVCVIVVVGGVLMAFRSSSKRTADIVKENQEFAAEYFKAVTTLQADTGRLRSLWEKRGEECRVVGLELRFNGFNIPECLPKQQPGQPAR